MFGSVDSVMHSVLKNGKPYHQGYLPREHWEESITYFGVEVNFDIKEVRVRQKASLNPKYEYTIKGDGTIKRGEIPLDITADDFHKYWGLTHSMRLEKTRLSVPASDGVIELDVYRDRDLFIAEAEFTNENLAMMFPNLGLDVTSDNAYKNRNLAR